MVVHALDDSVHLPLHLASVSVRDAVASGIAALVLALIAGVVLTYFTWAIRHARALSPLIVLRHISVPGVRHRTRVNRFDMGGAWDPSRSWETFPRVYGPGTGLYWLDDERQVHLDWSPDAGGRRELVGPVPDALEPTSPGLRQLRRVLRRVLLTYGLMLISGLALGYIFAEGSEARRLVVALFCGAAGYGLAYIAVRIALTVTIIGRSRESRLPHLGE
jgi:hypothetical protein